MENCGSVSATQFLPTNEEITHISFRCLSPSCRPSATGSSSAEVVVVVVRRGPIYQLDTVNEGDLKHWTVVLPPSRTIRAHSCLDEAMFCDIVSVTPLESSFLVMDRHRVSEFHFNWQPDTVEVPSWRMGLMNALPPQPSPSSLRFPTAAAVYKPLNGTHIDDQLEISSFFPHATNRFVVVTDTGNHRVVLVNITDPGRWEYAGQFGITGLALQNSSGLDTPWGIAVYAPAWESLFRPVFANVFVADRRNSRLVKLDLGYEGNGYPGPNDLPTLSYGGEYSLQVPGVRYNETLTEPVGVTLYRHYILVAEARGNSILVLMVDHTQFSRFRFVTELLPAPGVQLTGSLAASPLGYVWFAAVNLPNDYGMGTVFLPEALRWSVKPSRLLDLIGTCVNETWYQQVLRYDLQLYESHVGNALSSVGINWIDPTKPGYFDASVFNLTSSFDLTAFNRTVFGGQMVLCPPVAPPVPPPFLSGNTEGWNMANRKAVAMAGAAQRGAAMVFWLLGAWLWCWAA